jgi:hypothetical protein
MPFESLKHPKLYSKKIQHVIGSFKNIFDLKIQNVDTIKSSKIKIEDGNKLFLFQMPSTCENIKGQLGERMQLGSHVMGHC